MTSWQFWQFLTPLLPLSSTYDLCLILCCPESPSLHGVIYQWPLNTKRFFDYILQKKFNEFQLNRTLDFFSELTQQTIAELYELYKIDFEMFDFSVDLFLADKNLTNSQNLI